MGEDVLADEIAVTADNLKALEQRGVGRIRAAYLREAAFSLADAVGSREEVSPFYMGDLTRRLYFEHIRAILSCGDDKIMFARYLASLSEELPFESGRLPGGKIAYFPGTAAHEAYRIFSAHMNATVTYPGDFTAVCEEVYDGLCDYGILPIANDREGTLHRLRAMLERYDLRIAMTCFVRSGDGESEFALLSREILAPERGKACIAFSVAPTLSSAVADILHAALSNGLTLLTAERMPGSTEDGMPVWDFRFSGDVADFGGLLCYMSLEHSRYTLLGVFDSLQ